MVRASSGKANAVVADSDRYPIVDRFNLEHHATARRSVLGRIAQQVGRLRQSHPVAVDPNRTVRHQPLKTMRSFGKLARGHLDGVVDRLSQVQAGHLQLNFAARERDTSNRSLVSRTR